VICFFGYNRKKKIKKKKFGSKSLVMPWLP
jgi:hypothetical protein